MKTAIMHLLIVNTRSVLEIGVLQLSMLEWNLKSCDFMSTDKGG